MIWLQSRFPAPGILPLFFGLRFDLVSAESLQRSLWLAPAAGGGTERGERKCFEIMGENDSLVSGVLRVRIQAAGIKFRSPAELDNFELVY